MTKRALSALVAALVAVALAAAVIASSVGGNDSPSHMMPGGQSMSGASMPDADAMPSGTHEMDDGAVMHGSGGETSP